MKNKFSVETVGNHNAIVVYSRFGSKIILLEDAPISEPKERTAYEFIAPRQSVELRLGSGHRSWQQRCCWLNNF